MGEHKVGFWAGCWEGVERVSDLVKGLGGWWTKLAEGQGMRWSNLGLIMVGSSDGFWWLDFGGEGSIPLVRLRVGTSGGKQVDGGWWWVVSGL